MTGDFKLILCYTGNPLSVALAFAGCALYISLASYKDVMQTIDEMDKWMKYLINLRMFTKAGADHESPVNAAATKVRSVFREVDVTKPLHDPMVGPEDNLSRTVLKHTLKRIQSR